MQKPSHIVKMIGMAVLLCMTVPIFGESAPVYDVDSMPQQFDEGEQNQPELPPPPAPGQEGGGAYVPSQSSNARSGLMPPTAVGTSNMGVEQRVKRVEQQVNNLQANDAAARIDALQSQVQSLQGQVEQLTHQVQQMQTQQKALYSDLDKRLANSKNAPVLHSADTSINDETADAVPVIKPNKVNRKLSTVKPVIKAAATIKTTAPDVATKDNDQQPNVAEEQQIYQTAYNLIKAKKYSDAVNALQGMLQKYPSGQFASNAHYWLGELYGLMGKNDQALSEFTIVLKTYSNSPRVSDAQLKVGLIYATELKWTEAKAAFRKVINHYPGTASARVASEQIKQIKQAGH